MTRTSKRLVTKAEQERAGLRVVHPNIVSKQELLEVLGSLRTEKNENYR